MRDGLALAVVPAVGDGVPSRAEFRSTIGSLLSVGTGSTAPLGARYGPVIQALDRVNPGLKTDVRVPVLRSESTPEFRRFADVDDG